MIKGAGMSTLASYIQEQDTVGTEGGRLLRPVSPHFPPFRASQGVSEHESGPLSPPSY